MEPVKLECENQYQSALEAKGYHPGGTWILDVTEPSPWIDDVLIRTIVMGFL